MNGYLIVSDEMRIRNRDIGGSGHDVDKTVVCAGERAMIDPNIRATEYANRISVA